VLCSSGTCVRYMHATGKVLFLQHHHKTSYHFLKKPWILRQFCFRTISRLLMFLEILVPMDWNAVSLANKNDFIKPILDFVVNFMFSSLYAKLSILVKVLGLFSNHQLGAYKQPTQNLHQPHMSSLVTQHHELEPHHTSKVKDSALAPHQATTRMPSSCTMHRFLSTTVSIQNRLKGFCLMHMG